MNLTEQFYHRLPVRRVATDGQLHRLNAEESKQLQRVQRVIMSAAAICSVMGFLAYYLPLYYFAERFRAATATLNVMGWTLPVAWGALAWGVALMMVELWVLVLLNITGVHEIAVAMGFLTADNKAEKHQQLMSIGLEKKSPEVRQYGIDPFQGLNKGALLLFNLVLRLKGWFGNQAIRYLTRLLLGRYAVRSVLDFAGMPLYMAINAYSVYAVMREARAIVMGQTIISSLIQQLPERELSAIEKELLYDTLQYIAMSKRDFHQNHYVLTKELLAHFHIPQKDQLILPESYVQNLSRSSVSIQSLCRLIILLGFILDGQLSWRERLKLRRLNVSGTLSESDRDVKQYLRDFLNGLGIEHWVEPYVVQFANAASLHTKPATPALEISIP